MADTPDDQSTPTESASFADSLSLEPETTAEDTGTETESTEPAEGDNAEETAEPTDETAEKPAEDDTAPDGKTEEPPESNDSDQPDLKSMTRAERADYFRNLQDSARKDVETRVDQVYQPEPVDDLKQKYLDAGHDDFQATILAREEYRDQQQQIDRARADRAELGAKLATEAIEVLSTVDWLNPTRSDAYDKTASEAATDLYDQLCLTRDENTVELDARGNPIPGTGQIIGASMTPKQFYTMMDKIRSSGSETARQAAMKAAEEQLAGVTPQGSNKANVEKSGSDKQADALSDAFSRI